MKEQHFKELSKPFKGPFTPYEHDTKDSLDRQYYKPRTAHIITSVYFRYWNIVLVTFSLEPVLYSGNIIGSDLL